MLMTWLVEMVLGFLLLGAIISGVIAWMGGFGGLHFPN